jgi:2-phospho-L-lactate guanylyltransferase
MDMRVIIPVKPFVEAKRRLSPVLSTVQRARLAERMFRHVLGIAAAVLGERGVLVVSRSPDVLAIAESEGATVLREEGPRDLNSALSQAARAVQATGDSRMLAIASDLPLLEERDLGEMIRSVCAIAPDRHGRGTNAVLWPVQLPLAFGENSFAHHRAIAETAGFSPITVARPGLAHDVDVPEDLFGVPF